MDSNFTLDGDDGFFRVVVVLIQDFSDAISHFTER